MQCKHRRFSQGLSTSVEAARRDTPVTITTTNIKSHKYQVTHEHFKHQLKDPTECILQPTRVFQHYSKPTTRTLYAPNLAHQNSGECKNANDNKTARKSLSQMTDTPCYCKSSVSLPPSQINFRTPPGRHRGIACDAPEPNRVTPPEKETNKT